MQCRCLGFEFRDYFNSFYGFGGTQFRFFYAIVSNLDLDIKVIQRIWHCLTNLL